MSRDLNSDEMGGTFDQPPRDSRERAEAEWLLARDKDPHAAPPSEAAARDYEELEHLLGTLPEPASDQSWHDEVLKKAAGRDPSIIEKKRKSSEAPLVNRAWWQSAALRWGTGGLAAAAAVVIFLKFSTRDTGPAGDASSLSVERIASHDVRDDEGKTTGFKVDSPIGDLRIIRRGIDGSEELVKRCNGAGSCEQKGKRFAFDFVCEKAGEYYYVVVGIGGDEVPEAATARQFVVKVHESGGKARLETPPKCD